MRIDGVSLCLSPGEVVSLVRSLPLPKGIRIGDVSLTESGVEVTLRASMLLGLPLKMKAEIERVSGSKIFLRVSPPVKPNWLTVRAMVMALPGANYAGNSVIEIDLVSALRGLLSGISLRKVVLNRNGFAGEAAGVDVNAGWEEILGRISW